MSHDHHQIIDLLNFVELFANHRYEKNVINQVKKFHWEMQFALHLYVVSMLRYD
jgi:hypothetical protein